MNTPQRLPQRLILLTNIGTIIEWAEFTFYAYIALTIAELFFPHYDNRMALLATFSVFALGYLARPLGAILFGYLGDRFGRRIALQLSIFLMGIATLAIGLLPSYEQIGFSAPLLLLLFRALQGVAVSGEFNGSALYLIERYPEKPCFAGSWTAWSAGVGMVIGSTLAMIIALPGMPAWAWRLPFLAGAMICWYAYFLRHSLTETADFLLAKQQRKLKRFPLLSLLKNHRIAFIKTFFIATTVGIFLYVANVYYVTSLQQHTALPAYQIKLLVTLGELLFVILCPFVALLADHYDDKKIIMLGLISLCLTAPLLFSLIQTQNFTLLLIGQIAYGISDALLSAPLFKFLQDLFPTEIRYTGISVAWNLAMAIFGGTAPMVAVYLQNYLHSIIAPGLYIIASAIVAIFLIAFDSNGSKHSRAMAQVHV